MPTIADYTCLERVSKMSSKNSQVAIVKCENYEKESIHEAMARIFDLIDIKSCNEKILIKPNLCLPAHPDEALTVHPEVISCLCNIFNKSGSKIFIGDNPVGSSDKVRIDDVWKKTGFAEMALSHRVQKAYLNKNLKKSVGVINGESYDMYFSEDISSFGSIINVAKFKTHSLMTFTGCVKNLYGLLAGDSKKKLHKQFSSKDNFANLLLDVYDLFPCSLHIMDAVYGIEGNGPGREGKKRYIGVLMASQDAVVLDLVASKLMNIDPYEVPTNYWGMKRKMGTDSEIIEVLGDDVEPFVMHDFKIPDTTVYNKNITEHIFQLSRNFLSINTGICRECELCCHNCPAGAIDRNEDGLYIDDEKCICCMTCREICPEAAIQVAIPNFMRELKRIKNRNK